jgi:hypothetical protein
MKKKVVLPIIGHNTQTGAQYVFLGEIDGPYMKVSTPNMYPKQWWSRREYIQKYDVSTNTKQENGSGEEDETSEVVTQANPKQLQDFTPRPTVGKP